MTSQKPIDVAIAGGGLAGTLIALRLRQQRPELSVAVIERDEKLGGEHTWSFHETDVSPEQRRFLAPLIGRRWPRQSVRFPRHQRTLETPYCSIRSETLHAVAAPVIGGGLHLHAEIAAVAPQEVLLKGGESVAARAVIDARG
ncbi:MAG: NAD(P)-binding protein, partial [Parvularculaceae bacterium]|nr:NAD(P)-binding protein [Parvularculaceae bacterium]